MKKNIIKEEYFSNYKNRVEELCGAFLTAYCDYFYLQGIDEHRKTYLGNQPMSILFHCSIEFFYSIINALQKEMILILCSLDSTNHKSNSIPQLKSALREYIKDYDDIKDKLKKIPAKNNLKCVEDSRKKVIAHIDLIKDLDKVPMITVKQRLDDLRHCYNSYLFDNLIKYAISDNKLKDIEENCYFGVSQLFSGQMDSFFKAYSATIKNSLGENYGE